MICFYPNFLGIFSPNNLISLTDNIGGNIRIQDRIYILIFIPVMYNLHFSPTILYDRLTIHCSCRHQLPHTLISQPLKPCPYNRCSAEYCEPACKFFDLSKKIHKLKTESDGKCQSTFIPKKKLYVQKYP